MGMRESTMGATDRLAQFITDTHYNTLPEEVVAAAKIGIMDGVANMLAGATQPLAAIISQYVRQLGGAPQCNVVGHDQCPVSGLCQRGLSALPGFRDPGAATDPWHFGRV